MASDRIGSLLKSRGIKVSEFAREIGVNPSTLYNIASGKADLENISINVFIRIAHGLGMTPEELFYGDGGLDDDNSSGEDALICSYRSMNEEGKNALLMVAEALAMRYPME